MKMTKMDSPVRKAWPLAVAALLALVLLIIAVFLIVNGGKESSPENNIENSVSAVFLSYRDDHSADQHAKWLALSLEKAGIPVFKTEIESETGAKSFSSIISRWHNWKQARGLDQDRVWLVISGIEPDLAVELSLAWENSDLVLLPDIGELKYFSSWQDFASSLSMRWPDDRSIMLFHTESDKDEAAALYERVSNEDAWLFPGQPVYPGSSVEIIRSSDGSARIGLLETGMLDQYSWSASYIDTITSELVVSSAYNDKPAEIVDRITGAADSLRFHWFLIPLSIILLILVSLTSGISVFAVAAQSIGRSKVKEQETINAELTESEYLPVDDNERLSTDNQPGRHKNAYSLSLRIILLVALASTIAVVLNAVRLLPLLTASWWVTSLVLVLMMIILIPDARLGLAENKLEKASAVKILSGLTWLIFVLIAAYVIIRVLILASVPYDSLIWLITGLLLPVSARIAVRRLSAVGCRIWLTLPAGAWLMLNGISIISHFVGFH